MIDLLGQSPAGSLVRQPNGQVLLLPSSAVPVTSPGQLPPAPITSPSQLPEDPPPPEPIATESAPPAPLDQAPITSPGQTAEPPLPGAVPAGADPLAPAAALPPDPAAGTSALPLGVSPATPEAAPAPPPLEQTPSAAAAATPQAAAPELPAEQKDEPALPPPTPEEVEELATLTKGVLAQQQAEDEGALLKKRNAELAQLQADKLEAVNKIAERQQTLTADYASAMQAKADYDAKTADMDEKDSGPSVGTILALSLGVLGAALARNPNGVMPVIEILQAKAKERAAKRVAKAQRLDATVAARAGALNATQKQIPGLNDKIKIEEGALLERYARDAEALAKKYTGQQAYVEATKIAAGLRKAADEKARDAAFAQQKDETDRLRTQADIENNKRSTNVGYARIAEDRQQRIMIDKRTRELAEEDRKLKVREIELKEADHQLKVDEQTGEKRVFGLPVVKLDAAGAPVLRNGKPVFQRAPLTNSNGKEWRPGTKEEAKEAREAIGGAYKSTQLIDKVVNLVEKNGWSSDLVRSKEWQEAKSTFTEVQLARKGPGDLGLGVITGPDMELLNNILGGDPTGIRDPVPSLRTARQNILLGVNARLVGVGYDGDAFDVPEQTSAGFREKVQNTPAEDLVRKAQARGDAGIAGSTLAAVGAAGFRSGRPEDLSPGDYLALSRSKEKDPRAYPTQGAAKALMELGQGAANPANSPEQRAMYLDGLKAMARDRSPIIRQRIGAIARLWKLDVGPIEGVEAAKPESSPVPAGSTKKVSVADVVRLGDAARERGTAGAAGIATGFKDLTPYDRARVLKHQGNKKHEDSDAAAFPKASANEAMVTLSKILADPAQPKDVKDRAMRELQGIAQGNSSAIMRRRAKKTAKQFGVSLEGNKDDGEETE